MNKKVAIILVNYNTYADTMECIESIKKCEKDLDYEIIVVDNCSTDLSVQELKKIKKIELIVAEKNGGFAAGNNIGIDYAVKKQFDYILLLNNDTIITNKAISNLIEMHESGGDNVGIVTCKLMDYYHRSNIDCCGGKIDFKKVVGNFNYWYVKKNKYYAELATGACILMKTDVLKEIGKLSEDYFMYYEDLDYSIRVLNSGYNILISMNSVIYHKGAASTGKASPFAIKWNNRNRIVFYKKYKKYVKTSYFWPYFFVTRAIYFIYYFVSGKKDYLKALKEGIKMGLGWYEN